MEYTEFESFIEQATEYLRSANEKNKRLFGIGDYARYEYDLFRNEIWWSDVGDPKVRAKVTIVGSISTKSDTWLWSWANPHFKDVEIGSICDVRDFGEREGITKLTEEKCMRSSFDDRMKNQDYRISDSLSCGISRVRGGLAIFGMAARNMPVACGVKLVQRIDARTLPQQGLKVTALPERAVIQRLALMGNLHVKSSKGYAWQCSARGARAACPCSFIPPKRAGRPIMSV
jgi:hypothetical protein